MPEVSLQSYCDEMRQLIAQGSFDQAIAIGRHILTLHPKHLQTYRIMGEACLEKGDAAEAHNLFSRALACDPEDLFARVGISVAHEKLGHHSLAIWHLERAYELAPGNTELRKELQRLYAETDGTTRSRLKLTPGAVARLYARSGLWRQAIQEYRAILAQNPDLLDVKVALADTLWNAGEKKDAAKVCQEILEKYPHCLKANLILGEIGLRGERENEGRAMLQLAQEIDPENTVAQRLFGDRSPLPARVVKVPRLETLPTPPETGEVTMHEEEVAAGILPGWPPKALAEAEPEVIEEPGTAVHEEEVVLAPEGEEIAATEPSAAQKEGEAVGDESEEGIPDWLQRIRERQRLDAQATPVEQPEEVEKAAPDWIKRLREEDMLAKFPADEAPLDVPAASAAETPAEEAIPDWLKQLEADAEHKLPVEPEPETKPEPLPDWLSAPAGIAAAAGAAIAGAAIAPSEEPELPEGEEVETEALPAPSESVAEETPEEPVSAEPVAAAAAETAQEKPALQETGVEGIEPALPPAEIPVETVTEPPAPQQRTEAVVEPAPAPLEVAAEAVEPAPVETPAEPIAPEQWLARARELRDASNAEGALDLYEKMIRDGQMLDKVLADLEGAAAGPLAQPRAYTLIGDLCAKQDRMQKALEAYRRALDLLKK